MLDTLVMSWREPASAFSQALKIWATPFQEGRKLSHHITSALASALRLADVVVELPDSSGQVDQAAEEEPPCWHHLGVLAGRANQEEVIQVV